MGNVNPASLDDMNPASLDDMKRKRCIVRIVNPDDELCLYRAVVVSLAHKKYEEAVKSGKSKRECGELKKEYNNIKKARTAKCRTRKQELAAKQLQSEVHGKAPADFDDIVKVAHHLKRNIVVLNMDYQNTTPRFVQFQTRKVHDYGVDTTLFVYLEVRYWFFNMDIPHFSVCTFDFNLYTTAGRKFYQELGHNFP